MSYNSYNHLSFGNQNLDITSVNQSHLISTNAMRLSLTLSLGAAAIYLPNSSQAVFAADLRQTTTNQIELNNPNFALETPQSSLQWQYRSPAFLPRIFDLITSSFRTPLVNLSRLPQEDKQHQSVFTSDGLEKSLAPNLAPMYLSQANKDFHTASNQKINIFAPPTSSVAEPKPKIYTVKSGDTINKIAKRHQVSREDIIEINNIKNSNIIFVNQQLKLPTKTSDNVLSDVTLQKKAILASAKSSKLSVIPKPNSQKPSAQSVRLATSITPKDNLDLDSLKEEAISLKLPPLASSEEYLPSAFDGYIWPAQGVLTSGYGWRWGRLHGGIDIAAPVGTPVLAAASGEVVTAEWNSGGYGNLIKLKHLDGSVTVYAHNNRNLVVRGQRVKQGEQIAEMGSTGYSTGSHLHFEIHPKSQGSVNPLAFLNRK